MSRPLVCLTLTGKTLQEDFETLEKYRSYVDVAELRADFLDDDERHLIKKFPNMAKMPCILTIRRKIDGGMFVEGEANRSVLFARALSFVDEDKAKNFAYVDFEDDFHVSSLQDAALAYGLRIIRSLHVMDGPVANLAQRLEKLRDSEFEIPKIAFMPHTLDDVRRVFEEAKNLKDNNHILIAMGPMGTPTRILGAKLKNFLTFTSPAETLANIPALGHLDPVTLCETFRFRSINDDTSIFGITGWPLVQTSSPELHNGGYEKHKMNSVYIPIRSQSFSEVLNFADTVGVRGLSVTIPHKEAALSSVNHAAAKARSIGACNTLVKDSDGIWNGYNTDVGGFTKSLLEFTGTKNLSRWRVAIIGAGGAARAVAYAIKELKGNACIFNRTLSKAKPIAEQYGFKYATLSEDNLDLLKKYNDLIVQTTSLGMNSREPSNEKNDPIFFYDFTGKEMLFDLVYVPSVTPIMARASKAGCRFCNGYEMLRYQGYEQFKLFTDKDY